MKFTARSQNRFWPSIAGLAVCLLLLLGTTKVASASPEIQTDVPTATPGAEQPAPEPTPEAKPCGECHLDIANSWSHSPHAQTFEDPAFQERWQDLGRSGECLVCHASDPQATGVETSLEGMNCETCHSQASGPHPPAAVPLHASSEYCGSCHTTTLGEWRSNKHASAGVGCTDCHDPHSQGTIFENPDDTCLNCHKDEMGDYLNDLHIKENIGCVDCHALAMPLEEVRQDGLVPTGHSFTVEAHTCVACHTDTLHAGNALPGNESGDISSIETVSKGEAQPVAQTHSLTPEEKLQKLAVQLQMTEATLSSRAMSLLFQGGIVGLVLGGSTAYFVVRNIRRREKEENQEEEDRGGR